MVFDCSRGRCPKYFCNVYIPVHTVAAYSRLRSADHGDLVVPRMLSRFGCHSFRVSGPTIWNDLPVDFRSSDITREQFKRSLKSWLFECAYGRRHVWETVQSEGVPKKWTYLLTYLSQWALNLGRIMVVTARHASQQLQLVRKWGHRLQKCCSLSAE